MSAMEKKWMIYGANGYTGELIAREAVRRGDRPVLAGRNAEKVDALAQSLGLDAVTFSLDDVQEIANVLQDYAVVLHCAGPFSVTAEPMMQACLRAKTHYLDITGEIAVFERAQELTRQAADAGVVLCPGVGFDVIPTDCVAATLKQAMPDATHLALGFDSRSTYSPGTAKTSVEGLAQGGKVRRNGDILTVPLASATRRIDFGNGEKWAMTIPWGDVSTAYHSTGLANIEVYIPSSPRMIRSLKRANWIRPVLRQPWIQKVVQRYIAKTVKGPSESARSQASSYVWGEVRNAKGDTTVARIQTANGYTLTIHGSLDVAKHLLTHRPLGGAYTPSKLMGADFVCHLPGSGEMSVSAT